MNHKAYNLLIFTIAALIILMPLAASSAPNTLFTGDEIRPADAIMLFNGKNTSNWLQEYLRVPATWKVKDGYMEVGKGSIISKRNFGDCQIHIEFWLPLMADKKGQYRANSGVYVQGRYEVQVLDSYGLKSSDGDCGGIYGVAVPLVNACRPPQNWQSYDITFRAPRFDAKEKKIANARMTVLQNGILIQDNVEIPDKTAGAMWGEEQPYGPLFLQDHECQVRYRNIWVRSLTNGSQPDK